MGNAKGFDFVKQCHRTDTKIANQIMFEMAGEAGFGQVDGGDNANKTVKGNDDNNEDDEDDSKECCLCDTSNVPTMYTGAKPWTTVGKETQSGKSDVHTYCLNKAYNYKRKVLSHDSKLCVNFKRIWNARINN